MDYGISVKIHSTIVQPDGTSDVTELYTEAVLKSTETKKYLLYEESEMTGMQGTKTMLSFDGHSVAIKRYGTLNSTLTIEPGVLRDNRYQTPYGLLMMQTFGNEVHWREHPKLDVYLSYTLQNEGGETMKVTVQVTACS